jgi:hypothetical protein
MRPENMALLSFKLYETIDCFVQMYFCFEMATFAKTALPRSSSIQASFMDVIGIAGWLPLPLQQ